MSIKSSLIRLFHARGCTMRTQAYRTVGGSGYHAVDRLRATSLLSFVRARRSINTSCASNCFQIHKPCARKDTRKTDCQSWILYRAVNVDRRLIHRVDPILPRSIPFGLLPCNSTVHTQACRNPQICAEPNESLKSDSTHAIRRKFEYYLDMSR